MQRKRKTKFYMIPGCDGVIISYESEPLKRPDGARPLPIVDVPTPEPPEADDGLD